MKLGMTDIECREFMIGSDSHSPRDPRVIHGGKTVKPTHLLRCVFVRSDGGTKSHTELERKHGKQTTLGHICIDRNRDR